MNKIIIVLTAVLLVACESSKELTVGNLTAVQTQKLKDYTAQMSESLLLLEAYKLFDSGNRKLSKNVGDKTKNQCDITPNYDSRNSENGKKVINAACPVEANWEELQITNDTVAIVFRYKLRHESFGQTLPVDDVYFQGQRQTINRGKDSIESATYTGTSFNPLTRETVTIEVAREENARLDGLTYNALSFTYKIKVVFPDFTVEGTYDSRGTPKVNGALITEDEFNSLFLLLK